MKTTTSKLLAAAGNSRVVCKNDQGVEIEANILKLSRHLVVFEVYSPDFSLRTSEVLSNLKILVNERPVYSGRAVVSSLVNAGGVATCEATLGDDWQELDLFAVAREKSVLREGFKQFLDQWQKQYRLNPEFKLVVVDTQSFLADLRLWLDQLELGLRSLPAGERVEIEQNMIADLETLAMPAMGNLFEKFEDAARDIPEAMRPAHQVFCRRQLHPLLMCSPFMHRIYTKPLGYAGDYEMVSMILRNRHEGATLFARLLNGFILNQAPAVAHRNRVTFLTQRLAEESNRAMQNGHAARVMNIGCGPAQEMRDFLAHYPVSNHASLTLLDFNDETITNTGRVLKDLKARHGRRTSLKFVKKSVQQLLKQGARGTGELGSFELVYCAGLFDYLPDRVCQSLMDLFYDWLVPGGLLVVTNVDAYNPIRNIMEYIFEWHLIYRTGAELAALAPKQAPPESVVVNAEITGSNIMMEIRKPRLES